MMTMAFRYRTGPKGGRSPARPGRQPDLISWEDHWETVSGLPELDNIPKRVPLGEPGALRTDLQGVANHPVWW